MATEQKTGLDYWPAGALQPDLLFNAMLLWIAVWAQPLVLSIENAPPGSPADGDMYLVGVGTGDFAGHDDAVAYWDGQNSIWSFFAPMDGYEVRNQDTDELLVYGGSSGWVAAGGGGGGVTSLGAGHGIDIDASTPAVPIVIVDELELDPSLVPFAHSGFSADNVEDAIVEASTMGGGGGGGIASVQAGHGVDVDATDPDNPIVAVDETELDPSIIPFSHSGFSSTNVEDAIVEAQAGGGGGVSPIGLHSVPILAGSITPSATGGSAILATIASAANQPDIQTLNFDPTTQEYAQFAIPMPKSWNEGTVTAVFYWSHAATVTNFGVVWNLQAVAVSNDDTIAVAFGSAQQIADTGGTTNDLYVTSETPAITVGGSPAEGDIVFFRVSRVTGDGSDNLAVDARLHAIVLFMTTDAATDA